MATCSEGRTSETNSKCLSDEAVGVYLHHMFLVLSVLVSIRRPRNAFMRSATLDKMILLSLKVHSEKLTQ